MKSYLIFGGSGFIGKNLIHELLQNKEIHVVLIDPQPPISSTFNLDLNPNFLYVQGNLNSIHKIEHCIQTYKVDSVIHLVSNMIPNSDLSQLESEMKNVILPTFNLIHLMDKYNVRKILFFSSGGTVYQNANNEIISEGFPTSPTNLYGYSKIVIENYLKISKKLFNINYIILRPSNVYGIENNWKKNQGIIHRFLYNCIMEYPLEIWGDGSVTRDYIYIEDLCKIVHLLLTKGKLNEIYNIGSGKGISVENIKKLVLKITKKQIPVLYKKGRIVDIPFNVLSIKKIHDSFNWNPSISLEEGIKRTYDWMKNQIDHEK